MSPLQTSKSTYYFQLEQSYCFSTYTDIQSVPLGHAKTLGCSTTELSSNTWFELPCLKTTVTTVIVVKKRCFMIEIILYT